MLFCFTLVLIPFWSSTGYMPGGRGFHVQTKSLHFPTTLLSAQFSSSGAWRSTHRSNFNLWAIFHNVQVIKMWSLLPHSPAFVGAFLKPGLFYQGNNSEFYSSSAGATPALLQSIGAECWVFPTTHKVGALQLSKQCMHYLNCFTGRRIMCSATPQDNEPKEL